jgi:twitching motility protein PilT
MASGQEELLFGRLALHYKLITAGQLEEVHGLHALAGGRRQLPAILVEMGYLTQHQVEQLLVVQRDYLQKRRGQAEPHRGATTVMPELTAAAAAGAGAPAAAAPAAPAAAAPATAKAATAPTPAPAAAAPAAPSPEDTVATLEFTPIGPAVAAARPAGATLSDAAVVGPAIAADSGARLPPITAFAAPLPALTPAGPPPAATAAATGAAAAGAAAATPWSSAAAAAAPWTGGAAGQRQLDAVLALAVERGASDIHIHSGAPIGLRILGRLEDLDPQPLAPAVAARMIEEILDDDQRAALARHGQLDFAHVLPGRARFRANAYRQQRGCDAVFRSISSQPPTLLSLGLPESVARLADYHQGMVLITGPSGCGKSSTLAALINVINETRSDHIVCVEDPIEYVHVSRRSIVNQRQVGPHTSSFARAMRAALREDPDVIAIGELRDLETIELAITAAETGHLVLGTLHTNNAIRTINRMLGVFPPNQQPQMRTMISESLRAVVSQRLLARADGRGRVPALEMLIATKAVSSLIRDNKTFQIRSVLQTGTAHGMIQLDVSLAELVKSGVVTREEALLHAEDPARLPV